METLPSLLLFARPPVEGRVKTRLVPPLTPRGALELYRAFLEDAAVAYLEPSLWNAQLMAESHADHPEFARLFAAPWRRRNQKTGELGERLIGAFAEIFANGAPAAVAVGSDHPSLARRLLDESFERLAHGTDAVVIPAEDGGYCAIGFRAGTPLSDVFRDIPWSTEGTLAATCERIREAGLVLALLESAYDVDRPEDLDRLASDLAARDPTQKGFPRATARVLAEIRS